MALPFIQLVYNLVMHFGEKYSLFIANGIRRSTHSRPSPQMTSRIASSCSSSRGTRAGSSQSSSRRRAEPLIRRTSGSRLPLLVCPLVCTDMDNIPQAGNQHELQLNPTESKPDLATSSACWLSTVSLREYKAVVLYLAHFYHTERMGNGMYSTVWCVCYEMFKACDYRGFDSRDNLGWRKCPHSYLHCRLFHCFMPCLAHTFNIFLLIQSMLTGYTCTSPTGKV